MTLAVLLSVALAIALGVGLGLAFHRQIELQAAAMRREPGASLFEALTMAGLSIALIAVAVLAAKKATDLGNEVFLLIFWIAAPACFFVRRAVKKPAN
jgi:hypothetical protein